jgi:hypothetical protein
MDKEYHSRPFRLTESGFLASQIASPSPGECPYTLFLGAGASLSSGVPHVNALIEEWKQEIYCHLHGYSVPIPTIKYKNYLKWEKKSYNEWLSDLKYYLHSSSEYGTLFQHTRKTREERQMYVEQLVSGNAPSPGYMYLAGLINAGRFNQILTTNFDDLLNDALVKYYGIKPINCAFDSAVASFNNSSLRPKIIKLHGDFLYDNIRNTDDELLDLGENMEGKMIEMCEDKGLVVLGYSGNDESIMTPIRENLRKNKKFLTKGIHWCLFTKPDQSNVSVYIKEDEIPEPLRVVRKRYPDRVFLYSISGFDKFMESVFSRCHLSLPDTILFPYQNNVANDFYKSCEALEKREKLTLQVRDHMDEALKCMEVVPDENQFKVRRAVKKWRDGADLRDNKQEYNLAINKFEESIDIVSNVLLVDNISNSLRLQCLTRIIGCHIGIAKSSHELNKSYEDEMNKAYETAQEAFKIQQDLSTDEEKGILASIFYNSICALGVESKFSGKASKKVKERTVEVVSKLKTTSLGREKLNKLKSDPDTESIRTLLS